MLTALLQTAAFGGVPARKRGFTLIELLVVVAIIVTLIAILVPSLGRARRQAKDVVCTTNLRQIGTLLRIYSDENNQYLPFGYINNWPQSTDWGWMLRGYITGSSGTVYADGNKANTKMLLCPSASIPDNGLCHYSCHPVMMPQFNTTYGSGANQVTTTTSYKVARAVRADKILLVADGIQRQMPDGTGATATLYRLNGWSGPYLNHPEQWYYDESRTDNNNILSFASNTDGAWVGGQIRWRHGENNKAGVAFLDGHAELCTISKDLRLENIRPD